MPMRRSGSRSGRNATRQRSVRSSTPSVSSTPRRWTSPLSRCCCARSAPWSGPPTGERVGLLTPPRPCLSGTTSTWFDGRMHPGDLDSDYVIAIERASVSRSGNMLLRDVSWRVEEGERWVVLGPNGAGKTTLLNLAAARLHPTAGTVAVLGERLGATDVRELRTRIGFASSALADQVPFQEGVLDAVLTGA